MRLTPFLSIAVRPLDRMDLSRQPKSSMTDSPKMYGAAGPASFPAMRQRRQIPQPSLSTGKQE